MSIPSRPRLRLWWVRATWVLPVLGVALGLGLVLVISLVDDFEYLGNREAQAVSAGAATTILAAIGGGMITFTGFVFSFVLLLVQFGSSQYSPRTVTHFLRARTVQWILGLFLLTITFCFFTLIEIGSLSRVDFVPQIGVSVGVLLLVASLVGFAVLLHSIGKQIRVDAVLSDIGRHAREQFGRLVAVPRGASVEPPDAVDPAEIDGDETPARYLGSPGQVVAVDSKRLGRLARRHSCSIVMVPRIGDGLTPGTPVARVWGADRALDSGISRCIVIDVERSLLHDPLYALRLLVDIAIRALSPAVNDPTTAVRSLDEIEAVLRIAADCQLGNVWIQVPPGRVRVARPSWGEIVDLALLEILESGRGQVQIVRRLHVLVDDLIRDVGPDRQPALLAYRAQLAEDPGGLTGRALTISDVGDRQGLGGSH